jgi:hypothetical protein
VPWNLKLEENFTSLFNYYSTFFFVADGCGLLSKKNRKIQQQIIIMPVILSLNLLKKNTSCCVGFQYSYAFSYWLYIWFFSLLIADRFWKFYRKFTLPPSRVKEKVVGCNLFMHKTEPQKLIFLVFCGFFCGSHTQPQPPPQIQTHTGLSKICFHGGIDSDESSFFQRYDSC